VETSEHSRLLAWTGTVNMAVAHPGDVPIILAERNSDSVRNKAIIALNELSEMVFNLLCRSIELRLNHALMPFHRLRA